MSNGPSTRRRSFRSRYCGALATLLLTVSPAWANWTVIGADSIIQSDMDGFGNLYVVYEVEGQEFTYSGAPTGVNRDEMFAWIMGGTAYLPDGDNFFTLARAELGLQDLTISTIQGLLADNGIRDEESINGACNDVSPTWHTEWPCVDCYKHETIRVDTHVGTQYIRFVQQFEGPPPDEFVHPSCIAYPGLTPTQNTGGRGYSLLGQPSDPVLFQQTCSFMHHTTMTVGCKVNIADGDIRNAPYFYFEGVADQLVFSWIADGTPNWPTGTIPGFVNDLVHADQVDPPSDPSPQPGEYEFAEVPVWNADAPNASSPVSPNGSGDGGFSFEWPCIPLWQVCDTGQPEWGSQVFNAEPLDEVTVSLAEIAQDGQAGVPQQFQGGGTCPAPHAFNLTLDPSEAIHIEWDFFCDAAEGVRPYILAFAWMFAAYITIGAARRAA